LTFLSTAFVQPLGVTLAEFLHKLRHVLWVGGERIQPLLLLPLAPTPIINASLMVLIRP